MEAKPRIYFKLNIHGGTHIYPRHKYFNAVILNVQYVGCIYVRIGHLQLQVQSLYIRIYSFLNYSYILFFDIFQFEERMYLLEVFQKLQLYEVIRDYCYVH